MSIIPCKLLLVGNGSVGKTSLIARFVENGFTKVYKQTVGLDFFEKKIAFRDQQVCLQLWDIGGQSLNSKMLSQYLQGAHIICFCYDVTDDQSFDDLEDWYKLVQANVSARGYLWGNKIDLVGLRKVQPHQHEAFIASHKDIHAGFCVSAQNGDQVIKSFYQAVAQSACQIELSENELAVFNTTVKATIRIGSDDEGRTAMADSIEQEDLQNERRKELFQCCVLS